MFVVDFWNSTTIRLCLESRCSIRPTKSWANVLSYLSILLLFAFCDTLEFQAFKCDEFFDTSKWCNFEIQTEKVSRACYGVNMRTLIQCVRFFLSNGILFMKRGNYIIVNKNFINIIFLTGESSKSHFESLSPFSNFFFFVENKKEDDGN